MGPCTGSLASVRTMWWKQVEERSSLRKKEMLRPGFGLVIICVALMLNLVAFPVLAAIYPCNFWGTATVEGEPVAAGTNITAWVGEEQIGSAPTGEGTLDDNEFSMLAEYGGDLGDTVNFKIGDLWAAEISPWVWYGPVLVDLTASSEPVTLDLVEGANIISYPGATAALAEAEALTNIGPDGLDVAEIIWARAAWTTGWWFYNVAQDFAVPAEFTHLENGRAYLIVVSENCTWELL